jgi:hypothetical protein
MTAKVNSADAVFCGVRGLVKRAAGKLAVDGTETIRATLAPAAEVVVGFGIKLQVMPAGGALQESCTTPPEFPTALRLTWKFADPPALVVLVAGTVAPKEKPHAAPTELNISAFVVPSAGSETVTGTPPPQFTAVAGAIAVRLVELTKVVGSAPPLKLITDCDVNPLPVTAN